MAQGFSCERLLPDRLGVRVGNVVTFEEGLHLLHILIKVGVVLPRFPVEFRDILLLPFNLGVTGGYVARSRNLFYLLDA